ncbi:unnamed protein product, partial [Porites evermanni]
ISGDCSGRKLDIAILGDRSRSLNTQNLRNLRLAIYDIVKKVGVSPDGTNFGIITFDSTAKLHNTFDNPVYQNEQKLKTLIDQKFKNIARNWGTRIDKAQKLARDKLFTPSGGDRPRATNVMLIFTDGKPTGLKKSDFTPFTELRAGLEV